MNQDDINEAEWRNPANWSWRGPLGMYASKRDTRLLVPKSTPWMGLTLNCEHPACAYIMAGVALLPVIFVAVNYLLR